MNANNNIQMPLTLVFSLDEKLVSFSKFLNNFISFGDLFINIFNISLESILEDSQNKPGTLFLNCFQENFSYHYHIMKDPSGRKLAVIITLIDISTNSAQIDDKIIQMDRLAQVGQLAASIAHEIRNPLAGISANVQVLSEMLKDHKESNDFFEVILEEITRMDKIIKELLNYSRPQKPSLVPTSIKEVLSHVNTLISAQLNKNSIKLVIHPQNCYPEIKGDFGQLIQIFLNCLLNASQAMQSGGNITITDYISTDQQQYSVEILDSGDGIEKSDLNKIFDPFFTTKTKGLGLGLNVTKKLMENHKGNISISSEKGHGTSITLSFPLDTNLTE